MVECRNTLDVTFHLCNSNSCHFRLCVMIFPSWSGFVFSVLHFVHVMHLISCHHVHLILHTCSSHASEHFSRCPFRNPTLPHAPAHPSCLFSCAGVKRSRNGPSLAKWPWYSTGRPPVKFRVIWRSFGTPTVIRKVHLSIQQKPPLKPAQNPSKSLPCSRSFDHDRVGENRAPFGLS